jgi:predicted ATPase
MDWYIQTRSLSSLVLWLLGYPERAAIRSNEALALARDPVASPVDASVATFYFAMLQLWLGDSSEAFSRTEEAIRLATEHDLRALMAWEVILQGWALVQIGEAERGLSQILLYKDLVMQAREVFLPWLLLWLARAYLATSRPHDGLQTIDDALKLTHRTGTRVLDAEMLRLRGDLLLLEDKGALEEAARCFGDAIAFARQQRAKSWELRATTSLARLLAARDRRDEARAILADIYNWFTEGFDTADLKDAKKLLDELGYQPKYS